MKPTTKSSQQFDHSALTAAITERISLLEEIAVAVAFAFTSELPPGYTISEREEPTVEERKVAATRHKRTAKPTKRKVVKQRNGPNKDLILDVLKGGPLSSAEVYARMMSKGWTTSSANPRSLVGVTLGYLAKQGMVRRVGSDWELPPSTTTVATPTEELASATM